MKTSTHFFERLKISWIAFSSFELDLFNESVESVHKTDLNDSTKSMKRHRNLQMNILQIAICASSLFKILTWITAEKGKV